MLIQITLIICLLYSSFAKELSKITVEDTSAIPEATANPTIATPDINCNEYNTVDLVVNDSLFNHFNVANFDTFGRSYNHAYIQNMFQIQVTAEQFAQPYISIDNILKFYEASGNLTCNPREIYCLTDGIITNDTLQVMFIDHCERDWSKPRTLALSIGSTCCDLSNLIRGRKTIIKFRCGNDIIYLNK